jgi:hypothetical protein
MDFLAELGRRRRFAALAFNRANRESENLEWAGKQVQFENAQARVNRMKRTSTGRFTKKTLLKILDQNKHSPSTIEGLRKKYPAWVHQWETGKAKYIRPQDAGKARKRYILEKAIADLDKKG